MSHKQKILIVEDEFILYEQLVEFFEDKGYEIVRDAEDMAVDNYDDAVRLIKQYTPDIAILDIVIKGTKDGIDLGQFIKQHYNIPVIYISAYNNTGNLDRLRVMGEERFVFKATKPLDVQQLWSTFSLALPKVNSANKQKTLGFLFKAKEVEVSKSKSRIDAVYDPLELKIFINWDDITYLRSHNASTAQGNNNILIYLNNGKAYSTRNTISAAETQLPDHFVRTDQSTIINLRHLSALGKSDTFCLIGDLSFPISEKYRKNALEKIYLYLGSRA